jgi:hypothetical protein
MELLNHNKCYADNIILPQHSQLQLLHVAQRDAKVKSASNTVLRKTCKVQTEY